MSRRRELHIASSINAGISYLFSPEQVATILGRHPELAKRLEDPHKEGEKSLSFSRCRKTKRDIYRVLARYNEHEGLAESLHVLEECLRSGWSDPGLIKTRWQDDSESFLAEMLIARTLLIRGAGLKTCASNQCRQKTPDFVAEKEGRRIAVEVYKPRYLGGLSLYEEELRLSLEHADVPWEFSHEIDIQVLDPSYEHVALEFLWPFSEANEEPSLRTPRIAKIVEPILSRLRETGQEAIVECLDDETFNIRTSVRLVDVRRSNGDVPARGGIRRDADRSGSDPVGLFQRMLVRGVKKKNKKRQAHAAVLDGSTVLVVEISDIEVSGEYSHPYYLQEFGKVLKEWAASTDVFYDAILFCKPGRAKKEQLMIPLFFHKPSLGDDTLRDFLGVKGTFVAFSQNVSINDMSS